MDKNFSLLLVSARRQLRCKRWFRKSCQNAQSSLFTMEEGEEIEQVLRVLLLRGGGGRVITVPLCERKRHTVRHIASTPYVVLSRVGGGGVMAGDYPISS